MASVSQVITAMLFGDTGGGIAAAGTTQTTATTCTGDHERVTSGSNGAGVILKAGNREDIRSVSNQTTNSILVYPPVGASINGTAANTAAVLPAAMGGLFIFRSTTDITAVL
jgi:hypothetical protein